MTLTAALNSARTGLNTTQTQISATSDNVANALTEGYVARRSDPVSRAYGGVAAGVSTEIVRGPVNSRLLRDIRFANSELGQASIQQSILADIVNVSGSPAEGRSISAAFVELNTAFQRLSDTPDSPTSQRGVLDASKTLVSRFAALEDGIRTGREEADAAIAASVDEANALLNQLEQLNDDIVKAKASGNDGAPLLDERDLALTSLSELIGIRTFLGEDGDVVITTKEGISLLDGDARSLGFSPTSQVPPDATLGTPLSGLSVNGTDITPTGGGPQALQSGRIAGAFQLRDVELPRQQSQIDELARRTLSLFQTVDASVGPAATGLFVELDAVSGLPIRHDDAVPADPVAGLAGRLAINANVDPTAGGNLRRLRDGVQTLVAGPAGDTTQINAFIAGLNSGQPFSGTPGLGTNVSLEQYADQILTAHQADRLQADNATEASVVTYNTLLSRHVGETGVNVDAESERLLTLEQAYAANAQVISTVNRMFEELLARLA